MISFERARYYEPVILMAIMLMLASNIAFVVDCQKRGNETPEYRNEAELIVSGWTFPWDDSSFGTLREWGDNLDEVSPYWYYAMENGSLIASHPDSEDEDFIIHCRSREVDIIPMVSNNHSSSIISNILQDPKLRQHHVRELLNMTLFRGFEGVDINYENIPTSLKDQYSAFIKDLCQAFHERGKKVYVSVFPKISDDENREGPGAYNFSALGDCADSVRIMAYNLHWSSSEYAGPVTSHDWIRDVLEYSVSSMDPSKVSLGIPAFGYDWIVDREGRTLGVADNRSFKYIDSLLKDEGIDREWNGTSRTPYLEYTEGSGRRHSIHYNDAESLLHEMLIARDLSIHRISIWRIGNEDPLIRDYITRLKKDGIGDMPPYVSIGNDREVMKGMEVGLGPVRAYDVDGTLDSIRWDLGDGNSTEIMDAVHVYQSGGSYTAELTVTDDNGNSVTRRKKVLVGPYPHFSVSGNRSVGETMEFDASGSWDLGKIVSFNWDLGDGTHRFHAGSSISHEYSSPGEYTIKLTVINDRGYTDTMIRSISIPDKEPPYVNAGPDRSVWEDSELIFDGRSSVDNSGEIDLTWIFPGGLQKEGFVVNHTFNDPGRYEVLLVGEDSSGLMSNDSIMVDVKDRTPPSISITYPEMAAIGERFVINASSSRDNVGITNITWKLPDGKMIYNRYRMSLHHSEAGLYHYTVDILDALGNWNSTTFQIRIVDIEPPRAGMIIDPAPVDMNGSYLSVVENGSQHRDLEDYDMIFVVNVTYRFLLTDLSDQSGIAYMNWTFGDGSTAHGDSVYHNYSLAGEYLVGLNITDIFGNNLKKDILILVIPTVNHTLIPVQPYQEVLRDVYPEEEEDERRILPILMGISFILLVVAVCVLILVMELLIASRQIRSKWGGV